MSETLLELRDVHVNFPLRRNWLGRITEQAHALNGLDLQLNRGETLGIVGESGCGKSTLAQLLMGMLQPQQPIPLDQSAGVVVWATAGLARAANSVAAAAAALHNMTGEDGEMP